MIRIADMNFHILYLYFSMLILNLQLLYAISDTLL